MENLSIEKAISDNNYSILCLGYSLKTRCLEHQKFKWPQGIEKKRKRKERRMNKRNSKAMNYRKGGWTKGIETENI